MDSSSTSVRAWRGTQEAVPPGVSPAPSPPLWVLEFLPAGGFLTIFSHQKGADVDFRSWDTMGLGEGRRGEWRCQAAVMAITTSGQAGPQ